MIKTFLVIILSLLTLLATCQNAPEKKTIISKSTKLTDSMEIKKTEDEWKKQLTPEQYHVLREKGTERPGTGKYNMHFEKGKYTCAACGYELFESNSKFDSHCGWPSFDGEIGNGRIIKHKDLSLGMIRTEILCARCGGHLGHLFDDGPTPSGLRYCVNSLSIEFIPQKDSTSTSH